MEDIKLDDVYHEHIKLENVDHEEIEQKEAHPTIRSVRHVAEFVQRTTGATGYQNHFYNGIVVADHNIVKDQLYEVVAFNQNIHRQALDIIAAKHPGDDRDSWNLIISVVWDRVPAYYDNQGVQRAAESIICMGDNETDKQLLEMMSDRPGQDVFRVVYSQKVNLLTAMANYQGNREDYDCHASYWCGECGRWFHGAPNGCLIGTCLEQLA